MQVKPIWVMDLITPEANYNLSLTGHTIHPQTGPNQFTNISNLPLTRGIKPQWLQPSRNVSPVPRNNSDCLTASGSVVSVPADEDYINVSWTSSSWGSTPGVGFGARWNQLQITSGPQDFTEFCNEKDKTQYPAGRRTQIHNPQSAGWDSLWQCYPVNICAVQQGSC